MNAATLQADFDEEAKFNSANTTKSKRRLTEGRDQTSAPRSCSTILSVFK